MDIKYLKKSFYNYVPDIKRQNPRTKKIIMLFGPALKNGSTLREVIINWEQLIREKKLKLPKTIQKSFKKILFIIPDKMENVAIKKVVPTSEVLNSLEIEDILCSISDEVMINMIGMHYGALTELGSFTHSDNARVKLKLLLSNKDKNISKYIKDGPFKMLSDQTIIIHPNWLEIKHHNSDKPDLEKIPYTKIKSIKHSDTIKKITNTFKWNDNKQSHKIDSKLLPDLNYFALSYLDLLILIIDILRISKYNNQIAKGKYVFDQLSKIKGEKPIYFTNVKTQLTSETFNFLLFFLEKHNVIKVFPIKKVIELLPNDFYSKTFIPCFKYMNKIEKNKPLMWSKEKTLIDLFFNRFSININNYEEEFWWYWVKRVNKQNLKDYFSVKKSRKNKRFLYMPSFTGECQTLIKKWLLRKLKNEKQIFSKNSFAYQANRSIKKAVNKHKNYNTIFKFDIKNFFNSITFDEFEKKSKKMNWEKTDLEVIKKVCFYKGPASSNRLSLPIGWASSPIISEICMIEFDKKIEKYLNKFKKKFNLKYTRYADDIVISTISSFSPEDAQKFYLDLKKYILKILKTYNMKLNASKSKLIVKNKNHNIKILGVVICSKTKQLKIGKSTIERWKGLSYSYFVDKNIKTKEKTLAILLGLSSWIKSINKSQYDKLLKTHSDRFYKGKIPSELL